MLARGVPERECGWRRNRTGGLIKTLEYEEQVTPSPMLQSLCVPVPFSNMALSQWDTVTSLALERMKVTVHSILSLSAKLHSVQEEAKQIWCGAEHLVIPTPNLCTPSWVKLP